jgi:hypothetical protein
LAHEPDEDPAAVSVRLMASIGRLVEELQTEYPQRPRSEKDRWWLPARMGGAAPTIEESDRRAAERRLRRKADRDARRKD